MTRGASRALCREWTACSTVLDLSHVRGAFELAAISLSLLIGGIPRSLNVAAIDTENHAANDA